MNHQLIKSAPIILAALKKLVEIEELLEDGSGPGHTPKCLRDAINEAKEAIAEAEK